MRVDLPAALADAADAKCPMKEQKELLLADWHAAKRSGLHLPLRRYLHVLDQAKAGNRALADQLQRIAMTADALSAAREEQAAGTECEAEVARRAREAGIEQEAREIPLRANLNSCSGFGVGLTVFAASEVAADADVATAAAAAAKGRNHRKLARAEAVTAAHLAAVPLSTEAQEALPVLPPPRYRSVRQEVECTATLEELAAAIPPSSFEIDCRGRSCHFGQLLIELGNLNSGCDPIDGVSQLHVQLAALLWVASVLRGHQGMAFEGIKGIGTLFVDKSSSVHLEKLQNVDSRCVSVVVHGL